jgi:hypothetical protein
MEETNIKKIVKDAWHAFRKHNGGAYKIIK